jgi:hypothetical protein
VKGEKRKVIILAVRQDFDLMYYRDHGGKALKKAFLKSLWTLCLCGEFRLRSFRVHIRLLGEHGSVPVIHIFVFKL